MIKNRFTNSYEPIFVFSKSKNNYFSEFNENNTIYSNILKVNLQPSQYKHVAVYPENLVVNLLEMVTLNEGNTILDMFAVSGTTLKVVKDFNESILFNKKLNAIMIENNLDYINIIKKRCILENIIEDHCNYIKYEYDIIKECYNINIKNQINIDIDRKGFFKIFEKKLEFYNFVSNILNNNIKNKLDLNATCFLGSK